MNLEVRPIEDEEFADYTRTIMSAFGGHPTDEDLEFQRIGFERDRSLAAFDAGAVVGCAGAISFELTLPGGTSTPVAGVTAVGMRPTHRRRGLLTALMGRQLDDVAARGEALAVLLASESVIYGRFGYGQANTNAHWELRTEGTRFRQRPSQAGRFRLVDKEEASKLVPALHDRIRLRHPGAVGSNEGWWERWFVDRKEWHDGASARFYVIHESAGGEPDGYLAYRVKEGDWRHGLADNTLQIASLEAVDDETAAALLEYAIEVDLVAKVTAWSRPVDEPLRWRLADPRRMSLTDAGDHLWARLVDIPAALAARRYGTDDRLVIEVVDAFRPANDGRYFIEGGPEGAACTRTEDEPDLAMGIEDLGALYLGGVQPTVLAKAGRVAERTSGALRRADALFLSSPAPWCWAGF